MTLLQTRGANAARSRTVPMFAALAPLLIFVGFDGVVHGVARSAFHQGKFVKGRIDRLFSLALARDGSLFALETTSQKLASIYIYIYI